MNRILLVLALTGLSALLSCASREQLRHEKESQATVADLDENLRVGMSLDEVKEITAKVGECRGSPKSYMTCQASFMTRTGRFFPLRPSPQTISTDTYTNYILDFEKDKLRRWKKETEAWAR